MNAFVIQSALLIEPSGTPAIQARRGFRKGHHQQLHLPSPSPLSIPATPTQHALTRPC